MNIPAREKISQRLKDLRVKKGKTIFEMAEETGLGASAISNYESGLRVPIDSVKVILARYFGVTVEELFFTT